MARPTMSVASDCATADTTLPTMNITLAPNIDGLRPKMSDTRPHIGIEDATAIRYADAIQAYVEEEALRLRAMAGNAVATMI